MDGIRAVGVLLVFVGHKTSWGEQLGLAGSGVHLFFVLSGFLIIGILYGQRRQIEAGTSNFAREWRDFSIRRAFRIFPPYFAVVLVAAIAFHFSGWRVLLLATFTENLDVAFRAFNYPLVGAHLWSLCVEEQFYLVAAPLLLATACNRMREVCWVAIVVAAIYTVSLWLAGFPLLSIYVGPSNFGLMALGGIVALTLPSAKFSPLAGGLALALFLAIAASVAWVISEGWLMIATVVVAPVTAAVLIGSVATHQTSKLTQILDYAPIRHLGRISYMFYLIHPFVSVEALFPHLPGAAQVPLNFGVTVALSAVSWSLLEAPLLAYGRALVPRRQPVESEIPARL